MKINKQKEQMETYKIKILCSRKEYKHLAYAMLKYEYLAEYPYNRREEV
jgi:hypothetical protein